MTAENGGKVEAKAAESFEKVFGRGKEISVFFAPGRVNLIGEHTDYNGGHVLPCALTMGTYAYVRKREVPEFRFYSLNFPEQGMKSVLPSSLCKEQHWTDYPKGVLWVMKKRGYEIPFGLDILIDGNIPAGSGLSSSASLEVLIGLVLAKSYGWDLSLTDIALIAQEAENQFCGLNCGIMDQFASAMGQKDCAIFLDTNTLDYAYAPLDLGEAALVIVNSRVKHALVDSAYNERRSECEAALRDLQKVMDVQTLGDLSVSEFDAHQSAISNPVWAKRAKHAVYENVRTLLAKEALERKEFTRFGELMRESHISLRDDYQVSCKEIDFLVEKAYNTKGVIGSRITGGGFGGCTVNIVLKDVLSDFTRDITEAYEKETGLQAEVYVGFAGAGAHEIAKGEQR